MSIARRVLKFLAIGAVMAGVGCGETDPEYGVSEQSICSSATTSCSCSFGDAHSDVRGSDGTCSQPAVGNPDDPSTLGNLNSLTDHDWWRFTTNASPGYYTYTFHTDRPLGMVSTTNTFCDIFASATSAFAIRVNDNDTNAIVTVGAPNCLVTLTTNQQNRTYYVRVRRGSLCAENGTGTAPCTGQYQALLFSGPAGDPDSPPPDTIPDGDGDGWGDIDDNCASISNPEQDDCDFDGIGDACDPDNSAADSDEDGIPDCAAAITDIDSDGIDDTADNCVDTPNSDQADLDADGEGDACDTDDDGDTIADAGDNCPTDSNADQADLDADGLGDACDDDDDGDTIADSLDNCAAQPNADQTDTDGDGLGDACDADDDNDGVADGGDNCPVDVNPSQADFDADGHGDECDADTDNDGVSNGDDVCPGSPAGLAVSTAAETAGCTGDQLIDLRCDCTTFSKRIQYASCVANAGADAVHQHLMTILQAALRVLAALTGTCG